MELSLVFFTVLSQAAVGLFGFSFLAEHHGLFGSRLTDGKALKINQALAVIFLGLGTASSLLHLGDPFGFLRAFTALGSSWLSREALFFALTGVAFALYFVAGQKSWRYPLGWVGVVLGISGILSQAKIYMMPSMPGWNTWLTPVGFLFTAILLGLTLVGALWKGDAQPQIEKVLAILSAVGLAIYLIGVFTMGGAPAGNTTKTLWMSNWLYWFQLLVGYGASLVYLLLSINGKIGKSPSYSLVFLLFLLAELAGRAVYYASGVADSISTF